MKTKLFIIVLLILCQYGFTQQNFPFTKSKIDSINSINVQGVEISQDSLRLLIEKSIKSAEVLNYKIGIAEGFLKLGINDYYQGNYKEHFEHQLKAIKIYEDINEFALAAKAYGQIGYLTRRRDLSTANSLMQKALVLAKKDSIKSKIQDIYNNYSILKLMEKRFDSARFYAEKGLKIKQIIKDSFGIPYSYANIANTYLVEGKLNKAKNIFNKSF